MDTVELLGSALGDAESCLDLVDDEHRPVIGRRLLQGLQPLRVAEMLPQLPMMGSSKTAAMSSPLAAKRDSRA